MIGSFKYGWFKVDTTTVPSSLFIPFITTASTYVLFTGTRTAKSAGQNTNGRLGDGSTLDKTSLVSVSSNTNDIFRNISNIYPNMRNTFFVRSTDNTIWGTGYNLNAALGIGGVLNGNEPIPRQTLTAENVPLTNIIACVGDNENNLFLRSDGTIFTAGSNTNGQLGIGSTSLWTYAVTGKDTSSPHSTQGIFFSGSLPVFS